MWRKMCSWPRFVALTIATFVTSPVVGAGHGEKALGEAADSQRLGRRVRELTDSLRARPLDQAASVQFMELCETREKLFEYHEAARCYQKAYDTWPTLSIGREAVWAAARLHRRLQDFQAALELYAKIAADSAFETSRRSDARVLAARLRRLLQERKVPQQVPEPDPRWIGRSGGTR